MLIWSMNQIIGQNSSQKFYIEKLGVTNIVKNSDKSKYMYGGYGIVFDGKGNCSFGNGFVRNVII